jgi:hypothetical protein
LVLLLEQMMLLQFQLVLLQLQMVLHLASIAVDPSAAGATSAQVAASPTLNASSSSLCYTIMLLLLRP